MQKSLAGLPDPMNEVEISMPDLSQEQLPVEELLEEDAADVDRRREQAEREQHEAEKQKQSQPVKRGLPRPAMPQMMLFSTSFGSNDPQTSSSTTAPATSMILRQAESLLHEEMVALVTHD